MEKKGEANNVARSERGELQAARVDGSRSELQTTVQEPRNKIEAAVGGLKGRRQAGAPFRAENGVASLRSNGP